MKFFASAFRGSRGPASKKAMVILLSFFLVLAAFSAVNAQDCECKNCHGPNGPHSGGFPGCDACHGYPPVVNQPGDGGLVHYPSPTGSTTAGAHELHATTAGYAFDCQTCHYGGMPVSLIADNGELQMGFNYMGQGGGTYDGHALLSPYTYVATDGTSVSTNGTMTCSNIYCHSDGTSLSTGTTPNGKSPAWGSTVPIACDACHGYPPQYPQDQPKSNSHVIHFQQLSQNSWFSCATCHYATTTDGVNITNTANHVNMKYDVSPDTTNGTNFTYVYDKGGGTCTNITCHGGPHPGYLNVWGAVALSSTSANATYGPGCYQVTFTGSASGGTSPYTFSWDFGDNTTGAGSPVIHSYPGSGPYSATVTARDVNNHIGKATIQVTPVAANAFPVINQSIAASGYTVTLTDLSYDPDYNLCGHSGSGIISISWGDGTPAMSQSINLTDSPSNIEFSHTYGNKSTYTIQHYITDNSGAGPVFSGNIQVVVPAQLTISGKVLHADGTALQYVQMTLRKSSTGTAFQLQTTNASGSYSFTGIPGTECYYVTATMPGSGETFSPTSSGNLCSSSNSVDFTATP